MISAVIFSCLLSLISSFPTNHLIARRDTTSSEDCMNKCSREVNIVCGNDGMVYPNSCLFDCTRSFVTQDLESVECPFVSFKEFKALNDLGRSSDQDDSQQSSLASKESRASQVFPNSNAQEDAQALLSLARLIRKVEGKEEENDDSLETLRILGGTTSLSNLLGHGQEELTDKSVSVKSVENIHQNIWNTLYALRKANQKLQSAKHAKQFVLHEIDKIVLNLKDDEKISYDPNSDVMNKVERLLKEKHQSSFPFKRHLIDYKGLKDNVLPLYNVADYIPESTTPLYKQRKSLNVENVSLEKEQQSSESSMKPNNEELSMNNEEHRATSDATISGRDEVIEAERSHDKDDSSKEDTEYTDAPDVFPNTESLENFNKRIITYDFGFNGFDDHSTNPFLSQAEEDYINTSDAIEREMRQESYRENVDRGIAAIYDTMQETTTTEIDTNDLSESTTVNDAVTELATSEEVPKTENPENLLGSSQIDTMTEQTTFKEVYMTELPENVSGSSQTISETDHIPVLESSDKISEFEILDTDDNAEESEESTTQHTNEKAKIKSRNRISDSNEMFATESLVGNPEDNTTQKFQETADDSNYNTGITEFTDFDTAENSQRDSTSPFETDISALLTSTPTHESSQERKEGIITNESTEIASAGSSSFSIDPNTDVTTDTSTLISNNGVKNPISPSSVDATNTDLTSTLAANSDSIDIGVANPEVTTTVARSSDATSTENTIDGSASSKDPFVGAASVTSEKDLITSEEPILTGNEPIFIPHPVPEDSDDFDRLVYPDTSESIENIFVGDESMNLPNYLDFVDPPRPVIV